jgi:hypothetical protein
MDEDATDAAWAQLDLEARRWEEAIKRDHDEFLEWVKRIEAMPSLRKELNDYGTERI